MKFLVAYVFLFTTLLGVTAAPTPPTLTPSGNPVVIIGKDQVTKHGRIKVNNVQEAARQSQINLEQAIRIANNPGDPKNVNILREAFGNDFGLYLKIIQQSLEEIRKGVLKIRDVYATDVGTAYAIYNIKTQDVRFGPSFHDATFNRAGTMLHERSHAFANTWDYFLKKNGRGISLEEKESVKQQDYWTGYLWSPDWPHIPSSIKVRNADSYQRLGNLARHQLDAQLATPYPKEKPIIKIIHEQDQIKKYGQDAIDTVVEAARISQTIVELAISFVDQPNVKETKRILEDIFGQDVQHRLQHIRELLLRMKSGVLLVGDVNVDFRSALAQYDSVTEESSFGQLFQTSSDLKRRVWSMLLQRAYRAGAFKHFSKSDGRGLTDLEVSKMKPYHDYCDATSDADMSHNWYNKCFELPAASKVRNAGSIAELGMRAQKLAENTGKIWHPMFWKAKLKGKK